MTPLLTAVAYGAFANEASYVKIAELLLHHDANVDLCDNKGHSPLNMAIQRSYEGLNEHLHHVYSVLGEDPCDRDRAWPTQFPSERWADAWASSGRRIAAPLALIRLFVTHGADVNLRDTFSGSTPLILAAGMQHLNCMVYLLANGAKVDEPNDTGRTALYICAEEGHPVTANLLLDHGANVNAKMQEGATPLYIACEFGRLEVASLLLDRGAIVNAQCEDGTTPVSIAASKGHLDLSRMLYERGANIHLAQNEGATPLFLAAQNNWPDVVEWLLHHDAAVDEPYQGSFTPLVVASQNGNLDVVKLLVGHGAEIDRVCQGHTALGLAEQCSRAEVASFLRSAGASDIVTSTPTASSRPSEAQMLAMLASHPELLEGLQDGSNCVTQ